MSEENHRIWYQHQIWVR